MTQSRLHRRQPINAAAVATNIANLILSLLWFVILSGWIGDQSGLAGRIVQRFYLSVLSRRMLNLQKCRFAIVQSG